MDGADVRPRGPLLARIPGELGLVAGVLVAFAPAPRGMSTKDLRRFLRCGPDSLFRPAPCRRPRDGAGFLEDVSRIASLAGADPKALAVVLRGAFVGPRDRARDAGEAARGP